MQFFPLQNYSQNVDLYLNPQDPNYNLNLLSDNYQQQRLIELKHTYFGTKGSDNSPWSRDYVQYTLKQQIGENNIASMLGSYLDKFDNNSEKSANLLIYGVNNKIYPNQWLNNVRDNIDFKQITHLSYSSANRAIVCENLYLRGLPTSRPAYYSSQIAGEGYPFDYLQLSAVYAGTPVYILSASIDKQWLLVMSPEYIGWVKASGVARVDSDFINKWQGAAYADLAGILHSETIIKNVDGKELFRGYVGMIFPVKHKTKGMIEVLLPERQANGMAKILLGQLSLAQAAILPVKATPANFALLFKTLQGRPYGWGNLDFNNDCSGEMKAIFTMFGYFMPRNAKNQNLAGKSIDITALSPAKRLEYLIENGKPLLTLVYIKGHILLYVGTYKNQDGTEFALSYQQKWGIVPKDGKSRVIVNKAVFLPLLTSYPENNDLLTEADSKIFQLIYLDVFPNKPLKQSLTQFLD